MARLVIIGGGLHGDTVDSRDPVLVDMSTREEYILTSLEAKNKYGKKLIAECYLCSKEASYPLVWLYKILTEHGAWKVCK